MEEKDEAVNRDIDQRNSAQPADIKEEQNPENDCCRGEIYARLRDALHTSRHAGLSNP